MTNEKSHNGDIPKWEILHMGQGTGRKEGRPREKPWLRTEGVMIPVAAWMGF